MTCRPGRPPDPPARRCPGDEPRASGITLAYDGAIHGTSEVTRFSIADSVVTASTVRPRQYAGRTGTVVEVRGGEIGVHLGSASSHGRATWFLAMDLGQSLCGAPRSPASPIPGPSVPAGAS
jgi:hypothetical protein